jgi:nitroreductase
MPFRVFYIGYALNWLRQVLLRRPRPATNIPKGNPMPVSPIDWLLARRSIRRFHANPIADDQVESLLQAALVIAVCGDPAVSRLYWPQDCSAATQNILLAGTALGLGTVWLGVHPRKERKEPLGALLGVPPGVEILSLVAVGQSAERKKPRTQYDPDRVHHERW